MEAAGLRSALHTRVELFVQCRSLKNMDTFSKSDPFVVVR